MIPSPGQMSQSTTASTYYYKYGNDVALVIPTVKQWPFVGDIAVSIGQNSVAAQAKL